MGRKMKDSGIEWIGKIPMNWNVAALKYLCSMQAGKNLGSERIKNSGAYPVYGGNGLRGYYSSYLYDGDYILIGRQGALCGNVHKVNNKVWATEHALVTKKSKSTDLDYLYYLLLGMNLNQYASNTAAQPGLASTVISSVKTCFPEIYEQKKIAIFLDKKCASVDDVFGKTRASIEEYKKLKQAVITEAVTKGVRGKRPMKDSGIDWVKQIPLEWQILRGKNLFIETNEHSNSGTEDLLTVSHITGVTLRSEKNVNMFLAESLVGYKICRVGDIAANTMWMWQGAVGVSKDYGVISPSYNTYRQIKNAYCSAYLDYLLRAKPLVETYAAYSTGITSSRLRLYPGAFLNIKFIVPPIDEQKEIADYLEKKCIEIDRLIVKKEELLAELTTCKKSLIYEYVTGKKEAPAV